LGNVTPNTWLAFEGGGTPFTVAGAPIARDSLLTDVGLDVNVTTDIKLGFTYSGQFAGNAHENAIKGNLSVRF
jgi:outer membrane autotransporter protein